MESFWNDRYSDETYAYGEAPNDYFAAKLTQLAQNGIVLLAAEGEGRNAVFAARQGWEVQAFDMSEAGRKKALLLAQKFDVSIDYEVSKADDVRVVPGSVDVLGLIYAHFPAVSKQELNHRLGQCVKPGGYVIFEAFSKNQPGNPSGGPKDMAMLFSTDEVASAFPDFEPLELSEEVVQLQEGTYHNGPGSVIRFFGRRR